MKNIPLFQRIPPRLRLILLIAIILLLSGAVAYRLLPPPSIQVDYIDVGHIGEEGVVGDSILLTSSEGKVVLIDGGYSGAGALEHLQKRGITHIDMIVLSHPHDDHASGLIDVLNAIPVDRMVANGQTLDDSALYKQLQQVIKTTRVKYQIVRAGDTLPFGRLSFKVLAPPSINKTIGHNNNSIVLRLEVGRVSFLFVGDAMKMEEQWMMDAGVPLHVNILKVGHHGDDTASSPAFLETVKPEVAIYSAGKGNMHLLPKQETLDNLLQVGADVYGTDMNGTITVFTDGKTYTIKTERGGPLSKEP
jgi:competence protein ComEC